ncbi:hypothetical protein CKAH01_14421 [Colletotrichum kahawae]|uniref:NACHT-NTPase and P-loop NTPases N-terminal domain-containing protein n=1 Tax=Colletotrichum kahawae TaxID=34407 RepID=A0AAD9YN61_COLKA|nr:hypothetical protein CKAH01_14421 [Colletotrichum kahawae]
MAEVLGIVSGALAVVDFTTKIGGVGISLKRLLDECNDMPDTLLRKAEQIQEWNELFDEAERQIPPDAPPALARNRAILTKFASKFRAISTEIQVMIDKLLDQSTTGRRYKRKIGAAKAVLRKDDIKALDAKLDEALAQFQLALSLYTAATLMTNPILAIERQEENVKSPDNGQHEDIEKSDDEQNTNDSPEACSDADDEVANRTLIHTITDLPDIFTISPSSTVFGRLRFYR